MAKKQIISKSTVENLGEAPEKYIEFEGIVTDTSRGIFIVKLNDMDKSITCVLSGNIKKCKIRIVPGDKVKCQCSPYDLNKGRITWRN